MKDLNKTLLKELLLDVEIKFMLKIKKNGHLVDKLVGDLTYNELSSLFIVVYDSDELVPPGHNLVGSVCDRLSERAQLFGT